MTTHKILQGDAKEVQKTLPDNSVNLIVTSPPYNVGIDYGNYKDNLSLEQYLDFINNIFTDCIRILSGGGI